MDEGRASVIREVVQKFDVEDILEIGFLHGKSSAYFAAIQEDRDKGHTVTIDLEKARSFEPNIVDVLASVGLAHRVTPVFAHRSFTWELARLISREPASAVRLLLSGWRKDLGSRGVSLLSHRHAAEARWPDPVRRHLLVTRRFCRLPQGSGKIRRVRRRRDSLAVDPSDLGEGRAASRLYARRTHRTLPVGSGTEAHDRGRRRRRRVRRWCSTAAPPSSNAGSGAPPAKRNAVSGGSPAFRRPRGVPRAPALARGPDRPPVRRRLGEARAAGQPGEEAAADHARPGPEPSRNSARGCCQAGKWRRIIVAWALKTRISLSERLREDWPA